jgi:uncharacterized protein (DUF1015 family)
MYDPTRVDLARVVAPPYDVISDEDRVRFYRQDPHNVVRLIAGEVRPTDTAEDNKYLRAARFYKLWQEEGVLRRQAEPGLLVYRHEFVDPTSGEARCRLGLLGAVELEPFGEGVLPHERTHARAKADRLSLTRAVQANLSPIFAMYEDPSRKMKPLLESLTGTPARLTVDASHGERHLVWSVTDRAAIHEAASVLAQSRLYIADGHHRYETALNFRDKMRSEHPDAPGDAAFNFVLMLLVDVADPGLTILPTHRVIHDVPDFDGRHLFKRIPDEHLVTELDDREALSRAMSQPASTHRIGVVMPNPQSPSRLRFFALDIPRRPTRDPVSSLDVTVLHRDVLPAVFGMPAEAMEDERYISYSRDLDVVLARVASGSAQAGFVLRAPAVADVVAVAQAGQAMPQKSTYFYPKPASGIVFNPLDPDLRIPAV